MYNKLLISTECVQITQLNALLIAALCLGSALDRPTNSRRYTQNHHYLGLVQNQFRSVTKSFSLGSQNEYPDLLQIRHQFL